MIDRASCRRTEDHAPRVIIVDSVEKYGIHWLIFDVIDEPLECQHLLEKVVPVGPRAESRT